MEKVEASPFGDTVLENGLPQSPFMCIDDKVGNDVCRGCNKNGCLLHPEGTYILIDDNVGGLEQAEGTCCSPSDDKGSYLLAGSDDGTTDRERGEVKEYKVEVVAEPESEHMVEDKICDDVRSECEKCESLLASEEAGVIVDYKMSGLEQVKGGFYLCDNKGAYFLGESNDGVANEEGREVETDITGLVAVERKSEDLVGNRFCNDVNAECDNCKCLLTSEENGILIYDDRSGLEQVKGACHSPYIDKDVSFLGGNDDRVPDKGSTNAEECNIGFVAGEQEIRHRSLGQELSANGTDMVRMENSTCSHMDPEVIRDIQTNCSLPCEGDSGLVDDTVALVKDSKVECQSCSLDAADKEREHPVSEQKSCKIPNSINVEEHIVSSSVLENGHLISSDRGQKELVERASSSTCDCHLIVSDSGNGLSILSSERMAAEEDHGSSSMSVGEKGYFILQGKSSTEAPEIIHEQKHDECKSPSLLRTSFRGTEISSGTDIELQCKHFSEPTKDKICGTCDNVIHSSDVKNMEVHLLSSSEDQEQHLQCSQGQSRQVQPDQSSYTKGIEVKAPTVFDGDVCHNSLLLNGIIDVEPRCGKEVVSFCALEGSSSQKSCCPTSISHGLSDLSVINDTQGSNSDSVNISSSCNNLGMDEGAGRATHHKPAPLLVFRRTNPKRAASSRNSQSDGKSGQLARTRNAVKTGTKKVNASKSILSIKIKISGKISRKRSNRRRVARHSVWGDPANLLSIFKQIDKLLECENYSLQSKSGKLRKPSAKTKQKATVDTCSRILKIRCSVSANQLHPNNQRHQKLVSSDSVDTQHVLDPGSHVPLPKLDVHSDLGMYSEVHDTINKLSEDRCSSDIKMLQHGDKDLESTLTQDTSNDNVLGEFHGVSSRVDVKTLVEIVDKNHMLDPGSSPDSDVYNPIMDVGVISSEAATERVNDTEAIPSTLVSEIANELLATDMKSSTLSLHAASSLDIPPQHKTQKGKKKKKNSKVSQNEQNISEHNFCEDNLHVSETPNKIAGKKVRACSKSVGRSTKKGSNQETFTSESANNGPLELENCQESKQINSELVNQTVSEKDSGDIQAEDNPVLPTVSKGAKLSRSKKIGISKGKSNSANSSRYRRKGPHQQRKKNAKKSCKIQKEKLPALDVGGEKHKSTSILSRIANETLLDGSSELQCHQQETMEVSCGVEELSLKSQRAWVQCDDCHKWRAISTELANFICETNGRWICKDNSVTAFASCLIPQEMSNEEINAELGISDASCDEDTSFSQQYISAAANSKPAAQPASWTPIRSNMYMHRNRRSQTIDEIMVCHCKPPTDGSLGCGNACLNRMLSIECVKGTCPCGDLCSNQKFQKRKYAKLKWVRCGKKGFGLQLLEDVSCGQFLIEYVGEVLDFVTYESRQRYYASRGQKHFYFMTLNGGEVIDACAKGNLGRFINHSCSPNCQTEKWMVNGEVCIGLFAMRNIKKGEEVTFDYNYERVVGAVAKKCLCGASACQGYIGGGENSEVVVQEDSDNEDPKSTTIHEDNGNELYPENAVSDVNHSRPVKAEETSQEKLSITQYTSANPASENSQQSKDICKSQCINSLGALGNIDLTENEESKPMCSVRLSESSPECLDFKESTGTRSVSDEKPLDMKVSAALKNALPDSPVNDSTPHQTSISRQNILKNDLAESSHSDGLKRRKSSKVVISQRDKKVPLHAGNKNLSGAERELGKLLDSDGGISKGKDSTRGYLKLLFLTAAGDGAEGSSKSIRDLSLILDALLKTKSRKVLVDIINKNGLQMLHNIMKQNRNKFNRIPIIRKLLKVLEFLALKEILTPEHMNKGPPCSGVESFRESILALTKHNDVQVHQIARNFRDKWIPRNIRLFEPANRDDYQSDFSRSNCNWFQSSLFGCQLDWGTRGSDAIICVSPTVNHSDPMMVDACGETSLFLNQSINSASPLIDNNSDGRFRTGKRKSGWDQMTDSSGHPSSQAFIKDKYLHMDFKLKKTTTLQSKATNFHESTCVKDSMLQKIDNEAPPGFELLQNDLCGAAPENMNLENNVAVGYSQERYLSHLGISYGMPLTLVQQVGNVEVKGNQRCQKLAVAPSMPFHPFPPLPPYPRPRGNSTTYVQNQESSDIIVAKGQSHNQSKLQNGSESQATALPSATGGRLSDTIVSRQRKLPNSNRTRWFNKSPNRFWPQKYGCQRSQRYSDPCSQEDSCSAGKRSTHIVAENEQVYWPPWPREELGSGSGGSKGLEDSSLRLGKDVSGGTCSEDVSMDDIDSSCNKQNHN